MKWLSWCILISTSVSCCCCSSAAEVITCCPKAPFCHRIRRSQHSSVFRPTFAHFQYYLANKLRRTAKGFQLSFVGRIVHELLESFLDIVMFKLLAFCCALLDVTCNIGRRFESNLTVQFFQFHLAVEVGAEQLTLHHVVLYRDKRADQFPAVGARCSEVLGARIVLPLTVDFELDNYYL